MKKRTKRKRKPFDMYVPQSSGMADDLGMWGWVQVTRAEAHYYYRMGFHTRKG